MSARSEDRPDSDNNDYDQPCEPDTAPDYSAPPSFCLRCYGEMVEGWLVDKNGDHGKSRQSWVPGVFKSKFWTGVVMPPPTELLYSVTYRCVRCGLLESYARKDEQRM